MGDVVTKIPTLSSGTDIQMYDKGAAGRVEKVILVSAEDVAFAGWVATFMTVGRAATAQNILAGFNDSGSPVDVSVGEIVFSMDATAALTSNSARVKLSRITALPTGGTSLTKVAQRTGAAASDSHVKWFGDASADGTNSSPTALTCTPGTPFWEDFLMRLHSADGPILGYRRQLITPDFPITLDANEGVVLHIVAETTARNPATNFYTAMASFQEFTLA